MEAHNYGRSCEHGITVASRGRTYGPCEMERDEFVEHLFCSTIKQLGVLSGAPCDSGQREFFPVIVWAIKC